MAFNEVDREFENAEYGASPGLFQGQELGEIEQAVTASSVSMGNQPRRAVPTRSAMNLIPPNAALRRIRQHWDAYIRKEHSRSTPSEKVCTREPETQERHYLHSARGRRTRRRYQSEKNMLLSSTVPMILSTRKTGRLAKSYLLRLYWAIRLWSLLLHQAYILLLYAPLLCNTASRRKSAFSGSRYMSSALRPALYFGLR